MRPPRADKECAKKSQLSIINTFEGKVDQYEYRVTEGKFRFMTNNTDNMT